MYEKEGRSKRDKEKEMKRWKGWRSPEQVEERERETQREGGTDSPGVKRSQQTHVSSKPEGRLPSSCMRSSVSLRLTKKETKCEGFILIKKKKLTKYSHQYFFFNSAWFKIRTKGRKYFRINELKRAIRAIIINRPFVIGFTLVIIGVEVERESRRFNGEYLSAGATGLPKPVRAFSSAI